MRKLFAMIATVAVVLSMFSGIAFAAVDAAATYRVVINGTTSIVSTNDEQGLHVVEGFVYKGSSKMNEAVADGIIVKLGATEVTKLNIRADGSFTWLMPTEGAPAKYDLVLNDVDAAVDGWFITVPDAQLKPASITRKVNATLDKTSFEFKADPVEIIRVTLKDVDGDLLKSSVVDDITLANVKLIGEGTNEGTVSEIIHSTGSLIVVVNDWDAADDYKLMLNGVEHGTVSVGTIGTLGITALPAASIKHNVPTSVTLKLTGPASLEDVTVTVTASDGAATKTILPGTLATDDYDLNSSGEKEIEFVATFDKTGTYTFTATKEGYKEAKAVLQVVTSTAGNYEYVRTDKLTEVKVGTTSVTIGQDLEYELVVIKADGTKDLVTPVTYTVTVDGVAATIAADINGDDAFEIVADKLGEKTVRIASFVGGVKKLEKEYTVKVTGYDVTFDVDTFVVNKAQNITFVVKDTDGNPINNAKIYVVDAGTSFATASGGSSLIDLTATNVSNGTYLKKNLKYTAVGQKTVYVANGKNELMAQFDKGIAVVGESVLGVASNVETLLAGKEQTVTLTVSGLGSDSLQYAEKQVGSTITRLDTVSISGDTIKVKVQNNNTKDITVRVYNATGDKCGEIVLKTVAPKMVLANENFKVVTENIYSILDFQLVDPRDNSALTKEVTISGVNAAAPAVKTADKKGNLTTTLTANSEFEIALLATGIDWDTLEDFGDVAKVKFTVPGDNAATVTIGTFDIVKASLASNPAEVVLGQPTNLTLTYKDGNGNAIANKKVYSGYVDNANKGTEIGTTDANGQIIVANQAASSSLKFGAATDTTTEQVSLAIPVGLDSKAPVVSAPVTTDTNTATITVTDNVRVVRVMINGVEDTAFFPGASYTKNVTLKAGANTFTVQAMDANYNTVTETITITYTPAANNSTVLQGGAVERKGDYVFVQIRQFEDLGATLTWNAAAKTATFVAGGKTVEVTVGSTTAKVNGVAATMPAAPINVGGRVMVPTRFIAEALGWTVNWAAGDIVTITLP